MSYQGSFERRRHRMFITRNTEYHLRDEVCVAVRDRRTGQFVRGHVVKGLRMEGGVRLFANGSVIPRIERPGVGDALCFLTTTPEGEIDRQIVTSRIQAVERPPKDVVLKYTTSG